MLGHALEICWFGDADTPRRASSSAPDAAAVVRNFLESLKGQGLGAQQPQQAEGKLYPLLNDLLEPSTTVPMVYGATEEYIDRLLGLLPPAVLVLSQTDGAGDGVLEPSPDAAEAAKAVMTLGQKKSLVEKVLRSPQFHQSLTSLTMALRDGGLPSVADALGIRVQNNGLVRGGTVPLGGGDAVEAFVEGVKRSVQEKH